ncbi:uncharacterized protein LOC117114050 [Anneissia japonica]|uniref:uncharacterized protein LOC117114050 n=1 Tax=Anneissia japonica TaxID=1529436 RepID=UPI00142565B3|nr:uncharacterized protein LOC117114050 [Anneissia japonica]
MQLLADYFEPKLNVVAERYKVRCRSHEPGETVQAFFMALKHFANTCQFANLHDDMICDQIVEKTNSTRVRKRLLMEKELTLTKAIQIAERVEAAEMERKNMEGIAVKAPDELHAVSIPVCAQTQVRKRYNNGPPGGGQRRYFRCGSQRHLANFAECPAKSQVCRQCLRVGHFQRMCHEVGDKNVM